jgi:hypothetical protein
MRDAARLDDMTKQAQIREVEAHDDTFPSRLTKEDYMIYRLYARFMARIFRA